MKLSELQQKLSAYKYDAYIVPHNNMFFNQDILPEENKILELTGFSGSAGMLLVTQNHAILWVDGRYTLQASIETQNIEIITVPSPHIYAVYNWCIKHLGEDAHIAYNPWTLTINDICESYYSDRLKNLTADYENLSGSLLADTPVHVFDYPEKYSGSSREEKLSKITTEMAKENLSHCLICGAEEVSWLLNLRSNALADTPVLRAFALIDKNGSFKIFGSNLDFPQALPFSSLKEHLKQCSAQELGINKYQTPAAILDMLPGKKINKDYITSLTRMMSSKNATEMDGFRTAHLRDGVAVTKFLYWLQNNWRGISELDVVAKLRQFREHQTNFYSDSFTTIAAFADNGAIVHYHPQPSTNKMLAENSLLLLDSGAQYWEATTDITRTIAIGAPTQEMIDNATTVLKAHISIAKSRFPNGTRGNAIDAIGRCHLWNEGKDYAHGTGHGVGCFLNVHQGNIHLSPGNSTYALIENMVTSIEPGYYKTGAYGIRIENLALVIRGNDFENGVSSLKFEVLTLVPIDKRLINKYLLSNEEISWLNAYHQEVYQKISPYLDSSEKAWLQEVCSSL